MKKNTLTSKKMLLASIVALAACGTIAMQTNAALPTPAGTSPTFTFGAEQDGAGSAANQVSYIDSEGEIKNAIVSITTQTPKYWLDQSNTGAMDLLGTRYDVSAASLNGVTRYSWDYLDTNSSALLTGGKALIANVELPANKSVVWKDDIAENTTIDVDILNNTLAENDTFFRIGSSKDNLVDITINSNIIGNRTSGEFNNPSRFFELRNGNFDFHGDIIGNNISSKYTQSGAFVRADGGSTSYSTRSFNFTGNVIGNSVTSTQESVNGGIINDYVSEGKTSNVQGVFANNTITSYNTLRGGILYASAPNNTSINVKDSLFSGNTASLTKDNEYVHGGVIAASTVEGSTVNISNTDFVNNKVQRIDGHNSSDSGNVIFHTGTGTLNITDSNFIGNTTNSKYDSYVVYADGKKAKINVIAENQDVIFKDNVNTANSGKSVYDIGGSSASGMTLGLTAKGDHKIVLKDGIYAIASSNITVNGGGETGTVEIGKMYTNSSTNLTIGGGTLKFGKYSDSKNTSFDVVTLGSNVNLDLSGDGMIDSVTISSMKRASSGNSNLSLNLDFDGISNSIDRLVYNDDGMNTDGNIFISINGINVISDTSSDTINDVDYFIDANAAWEAAGNSSVYNFGATNITSTLTDGGYRYTFIADSSDRSILHITRELVGSEASLVSAIADSTANTWSRTSDGTYYALDAEHTSLGALAGTGREFTINGNGKTIDGTYTYTDGEGEHTTYGGGIQVGTGQTLNVNNVTFSNFKRDYDSDKDGVLYNNGTLNLTNVTVSNSSGSGYDVNNAQDAAATLNLSGINAFNNGVNNRYIGTINILDGASTIDGVLQNAGEVKIAGGTHTIAYVTDGTLGEVSTFNVNGGTTTVEGRYFQDETTIADEAQLIIQGEQIGHTMFDTSIVNNNTTTGQYGLQLTGTTDDTALIADISGTGKTLINKNGKNVTFYDLSGTHAIAQQVDIQAGNLIASASGLTGGVQTLTGNAHVTLEGGTLNSAITGTAGDTTIQDGTVTIGTSGSIGNSVIIAAAVADDPDTTDVDESMAAGTLTAALDKVTGSITNNGTFNTHGTMNGREILGAGGTTILDGTLNVTADSTIKGTLAMNGQTINMQDQNLDNADPANVYPAETTPTYSTLNVGSLTGTGNLKIDVNMADGTTDHINITDGSANNATVTVSSVNVYEPQNLDNANHENYIYYVTGELTGVNFGNTSVSTITSDNHRYVFSNGDAGKLNVNVLPSYATLSEFIQGDIEGRLHPDDITATAYSLVDDLTVDTALGTVSRDAYNTAHGEGSQNPDPNCPIDELSIFLNGHKLSGTESDKVYTTIPDGADPTEYIAQGDGTYLHQIGVDGDSNPIYEQGKTGGVIVGNGYTLNISGTDSTDEDAVGTMTKFDTAVTVNQGGVAVITDMEFTGNNQDIVNNSTEGDFGLWLYGDNSVDNISGTGYMANAGNLTITSTEGDAVTQSYISNGGTITANADVFNVENYIGNSGTITLTGGTLDSIIRGTSGTANTVIDGDVVSNVLIGGAITINDEKSLQILAGNVGGNVSNEDGTLKLLGSDTDTPSVLRSDVTGDGLTEIVSGYVANRAEIENDLKVDNGAKFSSLISGLTGENPIKNDGEMELSSDYTNDPDTHMPVYSETNLGKDITYDTVKGTTTFYGDVINDGNTINNNVVNNGEFTNAVVPATDTEPGSTGTIAGSVTNNYSFTNDGLITYESGEDTTLTNDGYFENNGEVYAAEVNNDSNMNNTGYIEANVINNSSDASLFNGSNQDDVLPSIYADIVNEGYAYNIGYINGDVDNVGGGVLVNGVTQDDEGNIISTDTDNGYGVIDGDVSNTDLYGDVPVEYTADQIPAGSESEYIDQGDGVYYHNTSGDNDNPIWETEYGKVADAGAVINGGVINGDVDNEGTFMNGSYLGEELEGAQINADEVDNTGTFQNNGKIVVDDNLSNSKDGTFINDGTVEGDVDNSDKGRFYNAEDSKIEGDVDNKGDGVFQNDGTIVGDVENYDKGQFLNNGEIKGWADNYGDGKFTNNGLVDTTVRDGSQYVYNEGSYTNNGDIIGGLKNDGDFINNGTIDGTGTDSDYIKNYDDITNTGVMTASDIYNDGDFNNGIDENGQNLGGGAINGDVTNDGLIRNAGTINGDVDNDDYGAVSLADGGTVNGSVTGGGDLELDRGNGTVTGDVDVEYLFFDNDYDIEGDLGTLTVGGNLNAEYTGVSEPGATLNVQNGQATTSNLGGIYLGESLNYAVDADISNAITDAINGTYDEYSNPDATINISSINVVNDNNKAGKTQLDMFAGDEESRAALKDHISAGDLKDFLVNPIFKYSGSYNSNDGMLTIDKNFNPAVLVAPVAAQLGGYANMLNSYDEAFRNMDMYMLMTKAERQALKLRNKYASIDQNKVYDPTHTVYDNTSGWMRPYATFESVRLRRGPKVSNVAYGSYFGGESEMKDLGHGWDGMWGAYIGYNGSHQAFQGNSIYQNGGTIGLVGMAYKDNFFTGLTINAGANAAEASTMYGHEDFNMLMAGIASKTGYNWELAHGKFIIQPHALVSYSFVNTFDYTNAAGVRINSDPLHAIQVEPGLKFIGNLKNGWQPYAGISVVWNIMDRTHFQANDVTLPNMSIKPFVKYGVGIRKTWGQRFTGFFQTYFTNGGRNGVGLQAGFRWMLGTDPSPYTKSKKAVSGAAPVTQKTVVKEVKK